MTDKTTDATTRLRAAFIQLVSGGLLRGQQMCILDKMIDVGPVTSGECLRAMEIRNVNAWRARFTELQGRGLIREIATRICKVSGRRAIVWEATGREKPLDPCKGATVFASKAGRWRACAAKAVAVLEVLRQLEAAGSGGGIVGQSDANTAHLRAEASRAIAEFARLGGAQDLRRHVARGRRKS